MTATPITREDVERKAAALGLTAEQYVGIKMQSLIAAIQKKRATVAAREAEAA